MRSSSNPDRPSTLVSVYAHYSSYSGLGSSSSYAELYAGVRGKIFSSRVSVSPDYFGFGSTLHGEVTGQFSPARHMQLQASVGALAPLGGAYPLVMDGGLRLEWTSGRFSFHGAITTRGGGQTSTYPTIGSHGPYFRFELCALNHLAIEWHIRSATGNFKSPPTPPCNDSSRCADIPAKVIYAAFKCPSYRGRCASYGTSFPGFMMPSGSSACLIARNACTRPGGARRATRRA